MQKIHEELKRDARQISLTREEKERMRSIVQAHMRAHAKKAPVRSPYVATALVARFFLVPALCAVVVVGGVAYAAENALPGDLLYGFRVHVNEAMKVTLTPSPAGKAEVEARIAKERVIAAQTLEARGALDPVLAKQLEDDFNTHAQAALRFADIADQKKQPTSVAQDPTQTQAATSTSIEKKPTKNFFGFGEDTKRKTKKKESSRTSVSSRITSSLKEQSQFFNTIRLASGSDDKKKVEDTPKTATSSAVVSDEKPEHALKKVVPSKKFMNATIPGPIVVEEESLATTTSSATTTPTVATTTLSVEASSTPIENTHTTNATSSPSEHN